MSDNVWMGHVLLAWQPSALDALGLHHQFLNNLYP